MYPKGEWTESCLRIYTVIRKRWFNRGYIVVNIVHYEMLRSCGINGLRGRVEIVDELPIKVKSLKHAELLKHQRDTVERTFPS